MTVEVSSGEACGHSVETRWRRTWGCGSPEICLPLHSLCPRSVPLCLTPPRPLLSAPQPRR